MNWFIWIELAAIWLILIMWGISAIQNYQYEKKAMKYYKEVNK